MTLDLTRAKQHLRVTDTSEDDLIGQYLAAAIAAVEQATSKKLTTSMVTQNANRFGCYLPLHWGPDPEDLVITYLDANLAEQTVDDARIVMGRAYPASTWPTATVNSPIRLEYMAGFPEAPDDLVMAVLLLVGHWFRNREGVTVGAVGTEMPMAVGALIQPYRSMVL